MTTPSKTSPQANETATRLTAIEAMLGSIDGRLKHLEAGFSRVDSDLVKSFENLTLGFQRLDATVDRLAQTQAQGPQEALVSATTNMQAGLSRIDEDMVKGLENLTVGFQRIDAGVNQLAGAQQVVGLQEVVSAAVNHILAGLSRIDSDLVSGLQNLMVGFQRIDKDVVDLMSNWGELRQKIDTLLVTIKPGPTHRDLANIGQTIARLADSVSQLAKLQKAIGQDIASLRNE
jgi:uncharacterized phage infection (PIP) family protein YhgE